MPRESIETARLLLRPLTVDDLPSLSTMTADPDVMRYIGEGGVYDAALTTKVIEFFEEHRRKHGFGPWAAVERESGRLIGWCGLKYLNATETDVEVLYCLERPAWGKGYATEGARASLDYGFRDVGLERIVATAWPENRPSLHVLEKIGMVYDRQVLHRSVEMAQYTITPEMFAAAGGDSGEPKEAR